MDPSRTSGSPVLLSCLIAACGNGVPASDPDAHPDEAATHAAEPLITRADYDTLPTYLISVELRIDGHAADLSAVNGLSVSADGVLAVLQPQEGAVLLFDEDGKPVGRFGRRGKGPGEFQSSYRIGWLGDTLWVADLGLGRVTLISPELNVIRTVTVLSARPGPADRGRFPEAVNPLPLAMYPGDTLLVSAGWLRTDPLSADFIGSPRLRVSADGIIQRLVVAVPPSETDVRITTDGGYASVGIPFAHHTHSTVSHDGSRIALLTTDVTGRDGGSIRVTVVDATGRALLDASYPFEGETISRAIADSAAAAIGRAYPSIPNRPRIPEEHAREFRTLARERIPAVYAPVEGILLGMDDRLWLRLRATADSVPWLVLDTRGQPEARLMLPRTSSLQIADASRIWVLETDRLGVESVIRYAVQTPF